MRELFSMPAQAVRMALSVFDSPLDEDGDNLVAGVAYLDPGGAIVGIDRETGVIIAATCSSPPDFLMGAMLAFYRVPFMGRIKVVEQDGRWALHDGAGTCGLVTKVGVRMDWSKDIYWKEGRTTLMPVLPFDPGTLSILARMQKEAENLSSVFVLKSASHGFVVTCVGESADCFAWVPINEYYQVEDNTRETAIYPLAPYDFGAPVHWPEGMPAERDVQRAAIPATRKRTRCAKKD